MSNDNTDPNNASEPFRVLCEFLDERELNYTTEPDQKRARFSIRCTNAIFNCLLGITHNDTLLQIHVRYPIFVSNEKYRVSAAELLTRANYCLHVGKFEFDFRDGEVRFHVSQAIGDFPLEKNILGRLFSSALNRADQYFPALVQHLHAGVTPEDAVYTAELDLHAATVQETTPPPKKTPRRKNTPQPDAPKE